MSYLDEDYLQVYHDGYRDQPLEFKNLRKNSRNIPNKEDAEVQALTQKYQEEKWLRDKTMLEQGQILKDIQEKVNKTPTSYGLKEGFSGAREILSYGVSMPVVSITMEQIITWLIILVVVLVIMSALTLRELRKILSIVREMSGVSDEKKEDVE